VKRHAKKYRAAKRTPTRLHWRWVVLLLVFVVCLIFLFSPYSASMTITWHRLADNYLLPLKQWLKSHHASAPTRIATVNKSRETHEAEPEIHFEFYTTLPNMQMPAAMAEKSVEKVSPSKKIAIADAKELERELVQAKQEAR